MSKLVSELIKNYFKEAKVMQLATVGEDDKPWISNVYFVADKKGHIYWLSEPARRHSREIEANPNVAVSIVVKPDMPVIGLQAEGQAKQTSDIAALKVIMSDYVKKYGVGKEFYQRALKGINKHKVYKLTVRKYNLFDEVNFPGQPPQEWVV